MCSALSVRQIGSFHVGVICCFEHCGAAECTIGIAATSVFGWRRTYHISLRFLECFETWNDAFESLCAGAWVRWCTFAKVVECVHASLMHRFGHPHVPGMLKRACCVLALRTVQRSFRTPCWTASCLHARLMFRTQFGATAQV